MHARHSAVLTHTAHTHTRTARVTRASQIVDNAKGLIEVLAPTDDIANATRAMVLGLVEEPVVGTVYRRARVV